MTLIFFVIVAAIALVGAFFMITARNLMHAVLWMVLNFASVAILYITLSAPFVAMVQVAVYAGAIMVLFVFVIMLLNVRAEEARVDRAKYLAWLAVPLFVVLLGQVFSVIARLPDRMPPESTADLAKNPEQVLGTVQSIGFGMFTDYLFPFEATSVLILMAIVGAMFLAKRERRPATTETK